MLITHYLQFLLRRADRLAMASGVEVRVPLCDPELMQYLFNTPPSILGGAGARMPKWPLRMSAAGWLPDAVVRRPKSGFPVAQSVAYQDMLFGYLDERLYTGGPVTDLVDWERVAAVLKQTRGDVSSWDHLLNLGWLAEVLAWQDTTPGLTLA